MNELERKISQLPPGVQSIIRGEFLPALQRLRLSMQQGDRGESERYKNDAEEAYTKAFIERTISAIKPGNVEATRSVCLQSLMRLKRFEQLERAVALGYEEDASTRTAALMMLDGQPLYHVNFLLDLYRPN